MSSLANRTITLVFSSSLNYAVTFLSPIFLVRILDVNTYGQYREFIVYSTLVITFVSFGIKSNLLYFIPNKPNLKKYFISNSVFLLLLFSIVGLTIVFLLRSYIESATSFNFIPFLILYVFCFQNIDILDTFWLSVKRSDYVLYWSSSNAVIRTSALIFVAYLTKSIWSILYLMILLEILKTSITIFYLLRKRLFTFRINI